MSNLYPKPPSLPAPLVLNVWPESFENIDEHKVDYTLQVPYAEATGVANTYAATLNPALTAYVAGVAVAVKINVDNTGPSTININNLGPKSIKKPNGNDVSAGNLKAGSIYTMRYNGTNFILQGSDAAGNATPGDVLSGKTFTNDSGEQVGTMPNQGSMIITPSTVNQAIPAGYHDGQGYVKGDANLQPENIKQGVSIFGIQGTLSGASAAVHNIIVSGGQNPRFNLTIPAGKVGVIYAASSGYTQLSNGSLTLKIGGVTVATDAGYDKHLITRGYRTGMTGTVTIEAIADGKYLNPWLTACAVW